MVSLLAGQGPLGSTVEHSEITQGWLIESQTSMSNSTSENISLAGSYLYRVTLIIKCNDTNTNASAAVNMTFNSDTGNNYLYRYIGGTTTAESTGQAQFQWQNVHKTQYTVFQFIFNAATAETYLTALATTKYNGSQRNTMLGGMYSGAAAPSSIQIDLSDSDGMDGEIIVEYLKDVGAL